jgi:hypothetical protein
MVPLPIHAKKPASALTAWTIRHRHPSRYRCELELVGQDSRRGSNVTTSDWSRPNSFAPHFRFTEVVIASEVKALPRALSS